MKEKVENVKSIISLADGLVFYLENEVKNEDSGEIEKFVNVYVISLLDDYEALYRWYKKNRQLQYKHREERVWNGNFT